MHGREEWVLELLGSQHKHKEWSVQPMFPAYLSISYDYDMAKMSQGNKKITKKIQARN